MEFYFKTDKGEIWLSPSEYLGLLFEQELMYGKTIEHRTDTKWTIYDALSFTSVELEIDVDNIIKKFEE